MAWEPLLEFDGTALCDPFGRPRVVPAEPPTPEAIARVIRTVVAEILGEMDADDYHPAHINAGSCDELAYRVAEFLPGVDVIATPDTLTFGMHGDPRCTDTHLFLRCAGRFYDAEVPDGTTDWRALPLFRRNAYLAAHSRRTRSARR